MVHGTGRRSSRAMRAVLGGARRCSSEALSPLSNGRRLYGAPAALAGRPPAWPARGVSACTEQRMRQRHQQCRHLATASTASAATEPEAPTLDANLRQLLFMVHPDFFPDGSTEKRTNLEAVKTINSYVDAHRPLIEGADDAELPPPGRQPAMAKLYVRQDGGADAVAVTAMLHDTTQAQPQGFEKSMDKSVRCHQRVPAAAGLPLTPLCWMCACQAVPAGWAAPAVRAGPVRDAAGVQDWVGGTRRSQERRGSPPSGAAARPCGEGRRSADGPADASTPRAGHLSGNEW